MGKYQSYPNYKKASVTWLDEMPEHWILSKVKYIAPFQVGWTPPTKNDENFVGENLWVNISDLKEKVITNTSKHISDRAAKEASMSITPKGSLMYSFKLSVGSVSFAGEDMYTNEAIASFLDSARLPLSYLYYALPKFVIENASTNIYGARILNQELINNAQLLEPTYEEAESIANFLDYETAKIDTLIEKQQQLIKLLKEKRQAVISHAVTKGLNPQAPMKYSGVEWLGEVPAHWQIVPLKYLCTFSGGGTPTKDNLSYWTNGTVPWVSPKDMKSFWIDKTQDYVTERAVKESSTNFVDEGALLMVVRSGILQRTIPIAINTVPVTMNQDMKALKFNDRIDVQYAAGFILGSVNSLLLDWSKDGATVESIEYEYLSNGLFPVPPKQEQQAIISFINKQQSAFQMLEDKAVLGIKLLSERRTALISAAVTGKIDVRNWEQPND
ncbi:restriction endonuclease subunit S [Pseudoalteromonas sp. P1-25]|uniref:restriction endonuclease subunit S n=1 Tax=Pseudoalteromonas sp. P1-25 TaxID=1723758 RepID=UPI0006D65BD8|nr:restriction endonuclease subunit S [Pseudoalteromonas sp. P1-25]KPZ54456.1 EcoKI restriction-modification system protein HsdS [Pseudoalteromonas sp. P1-25]